MGLDYPSGKTCLSIALSVVGKHTTKRKKKEGGEKDKGGGGYTRTMLRWTFRKLSGHINIPIYDPKQFRVPVELTPCTGSSVFGNHWNGKYMKFLRLVDIKWILSRFISTGRDGYFLIYPIFGVLYFEWWYMPTSAQFGDKAPPLQVDWNECKAGYLR